MKEYIITAEVYSLNERRAELDMSLLHQDGFEYEVTLLCKNCDFVFDQYDSIAGLQPFQVCSSREKAEKNMAQTVAEVNASLCSWFRRYQSCDCD